MGRGAKDVAKRGGSGSGKGRGLDTRALKAHEARMALEAERAHDEAAASGQARHTGNDESNRPAKRARGPKSKAQKCIKCDKIVGADGIAEPTGDKCLACWRAYLRGMSMEGSFEDIVAKSKTDPECEARFMACIKPIEEEATREVPDYFMDSVGEDDSYELTTSWHFVGVTPAQFQELSGGKSPQELGLKLQDIPGPKGDRFKGIVMRSWTDPFVHYTLSWKQSINRHTERMASSEHCYQDQGVRTQEFLQKTVEAQDFRKLLGAAKTLDAVIALAAEVDDELGDAKQRDSDDSADDCDKVVSASGPSLQNMGQKSAKATKPPGAKLSSGVSVAASSSKKYRRGASFSGVGSNAGLAEDSDDEAGDGSADAWQMKVQKLDLARVLAGDKMGQYVRRLREYADKVQEEPDMRNQVKQMRHHLNLYTFAEKLSSAAKVKHLSQSELNEAVTKLAESKVDFPSATKTALTQRYAKVLGEKLPGKDKAIVEACLSVIVPWGPASDKPEEAVPFEPLKPTVSACEGSPASKVLSSASMLVSCFLEPLMELDIAHTDAVVANLSFALQAFETVDQDLDDAHLSFLAQATRALRCLICALSPSAPFDYVDDFIEVLAPAVKFSEGSLEAAISAMIKSNPDHKQAADELKRVYKGTKAHYKELSKLLAEAESGTPMTDERLIEANQRERFFVGQMRPGSVAPLTTALAEQVDSRVHAIVAATRKFEDGLEQTEPEFFQKAYQFLGKVVSSAGEVKPEWRAAHASVAAILPKIASSQAVDAFVSELESFSEKAIADGAACGRLVAAGRGVTSGSIATRANKAAILEKANGATEVVLKYLSKDDFVFDMPMAKHHSALLGLFGQLLDFGADTKNIAKELQLCIELQNSVDKLPDPSTAEFANEIRASGGRAMVGDIMSQQKCLDLVLSATSISARLALAAKFNNDVKARVVDKAKDLLVGGARSAMTDFMATVDFDKQVGGMGDGTSWKEGLQIGATLDEVAEWATGTLMKMKAVPFAQMLDRAEKVLGNYKSEREYFGEETAADDADHMQGLLELGLATKWEGMLCYNLEQHRGNTTKMKRAATDARKYFEKAPAVKAKVHEVLIEMVDKAYAMRRV